MQELVSVIVPIYNGGKRLERCVNSIIIQTYRNLEILLIDDGSTDNTREICEKLQAEDERLRPVFIPHGGSSKARNRGLLEARGEYIQFVDCDDTLAESATDVLVENMTADVDMVVGTYIRHYSGYSIFQRNLEKTGSYTGREYLRNTVKDPGHFYYGVNWNKMYRTDVIRKN
ncbi:MAG: glycosyltransferase, partial [Acetatifactor sp.]|nr:glycosyltransferase [Acetatifactor sp.]